MVSRLNPAVSVAVKSLLEEKHIYQHVKVDLQDAIAKLTNPTVFRYRIDLSDYLSRFEAIEFVDELHCDGSDPKIVLPLCIIIPSVKLFCQICQSSEAHRFIKPPQRMQFSGGQQSEFDNTRLMTTQVYMPGFLCQNCLRGEHHFIIRRDGWKFFIDGRSPMEHIELPKFVPKVEGHLYRDAIVAMHGGKCLAALFYLRTFIEQFARRQTSEKGKVTGEVLMDNYSALLPPTVRDTMPSLRLWYDRLSGAIHGAEEDAVLYDEALEAISHHFDIRRVHRIPEVTEVKQQQ